jgi:hypothetical protein
LAIGEFGDKTGGAIDRGSTVLLNSNFAKDFRILSVVRCLSEVFIFDDFDNTHVVYNNEVFVSKFSSLKFEPHWLCNG